MKPDSTECFFRRNCPSGVSITIQERVSITIQERVSITIKEGQREVGVVQKVFNFFSYKYIRQGFSLSPVSHLTKKLFFLLSSKNLNKPCTGLQTFLYIIFTPLINEFLGFLKIPMSRSFSFYAICWMLNFFLVRHYKCALLKQE